MVRDPNRDRGNTGEESQPHMAVPAVTVGSLVHRAVRDPHKLAADLGGWVLVGAPPVEDANEWSFRTLSARTIRDASGKVEAVLDDTYVVYPLKKQRPGPFATTILVGRSRTNDVCVGHSGVSKLHARVRLADDGSLHLSDAGSSNGTQINGVTLAPSKEHMLEHGMQVRFGGCTFQVFEPMRFASVLSRFGSVD